MYSKRLFNKVITILVLTFSIFTLQPSAFTYAQEPDYDRINEVAEKLNCPTCAGINLSDCRTQTCVQWKEQIGDKIAEGYSNEEVLDYFVVQYGTQVLQEPPKSGFTLVLWVLPFILLLAGGAWLFYVMRKWKQPVPAAVAIPATPSATPLSDDYLSQVDKDLGLK